MKFRLLIILTLLTINPSVGQTIEKVIFTSQQADEPPTKQGRPKYTIEFNIEPNGQLETSDFRENKKRRKLNEKITIDKETTEKVTKWRTLDKKIFTQSELEFDIPTLKAVTKNYELNFEIPTDLILSIDSFQFCQAFKMTQTVSIGGETITVTVVDDMSRKIEFVFDSNDIGVGNFRLIDYILCYTLLKDKIPNEIPYHEFFSKDKLNDIILTYQKTVECEGFYYKEYTDKNPNMTNKDRRMRTGWNFVEYMGQKNKKE